MENLISKELVDILEEKNITNPTDVQKECIGKIKEKKDLVVISETGSGKTLAYLLPIIDGLSKDIKTPQALILTPTHELASQVYKVCDSICQEMGDKIEVALLIGGASIKRQMEKLKDKPKIVIGTTGRILELKDSKKLKMHTIKTIVMDEGDRLLDEKNKADTLKVIKSTLKERQLLLFSASINDDVRKTCSEIMKDEETIIINKENVIPENINHMFILCDKRDKIDTLRKLVHAGGIKKGIVFVNNPNTIEDIVEKLSFHKIQAVGLHGKELKNNRRIAIEKVKDGQVVLLVSSDLVARGMDIENVDFIINFDIPENFDFYLHRVGRTGRAGKTGTAISIVTKSEKNLIGKYERFFDIDIEEKEIKFGKLNSL